MTHSKTDPSNTDDSSKRSLWRRWQDKKQSQPISDDDLKKYIGMDREELDQWAETRPGVGKNQLAGKLALGTASGLGGSAAASGYGGWGPSAEEAGADRGMKFPPRTQQSKSDSDDCDVPIKSEDKM